MEPGPLRLNAQAGVSGLKRVLVISDGATADAVKSFLEKTRGPRQEVMAELGMEPKALLAEVEHLDLSRLSEHSRLRLERFSRELIDARILMSEPENHVERLLKRLPELRVEDIISKIPLAPVRKRAKGRYQRQWRKRRGHR